MRKICSIWVCMLLLICFLPLLVEVAASGSPLFQNQGQNKSSIRPGENILLYAQGKDDIALDWAWLATNETGEWKNHTGFLGWSYFKQIVIFYSRTDS